MPEKNFTYISQLIQEARRKAFQSVNQELINLYWKVGEYVSHQIDQANWGDGTVDELSKFILEKHPAMRGFTRRGLYRMRQFYDTYQDHEIVPTVLTQINWSSHLDILSKTTSIEEKEFYIRLTVADYSTRLFDKELLKRKMHELFEWSTSFKESSTQS